jgi:putative transposase
MDLGHGNAPHDENRLTRTARYPRKLVSCDKAIPKIRADFVRPGALNSGQYGPLQSINAEREARMKSLFQSVLIYLAAANDSELANQIQYLRIENEILRGKLPKHVHVTKTERNSLLKYGKLVGSAICQLITIVTPRTFQRWLLADELKKEPAAKTGRPRTEQDLRELILRIAGETGWGYTRIHGELKKLGISSVSRSTVANMLRDAGVDPSPERKKATWDRFIKSHVSTLWACDFFTKKIWTTGGLLDYFALFFIHVGSRRVIVTGMTAHPDATWVVQQARNFVLLTDQETAAPRHLIHDLDTKFAKAFDALLEAEGIEITKVGPAAPNLNAYAERWVLSIKSECLDHFIVFGEDHLRHLIDEYLTHYLEERPHQGVGNAPLKINPGEPAPEGEVVCHERLGGVLKHYQRQAA